MVINQAPHSMHSFLLCTARHWISILAQMRFKSIHFFWFLLLFVRSDTNMKRNFSSACSAPPPSIHHWEFDFLRVRNEYCFHFTKDDQNSNGTIDITYVLSRFTTTVDRHQKRYCTADKHCPMVSLCQRRLRDPSATNEFVSQCASPFQLLKAHCTYDYGIECRWRCARPFIRITPFPYQKLAPVVCLYTSNT